MNADYKRDFMNSYLILPMIKVPQEENYQIQIITENHITGILDCHISIEDEKGSYYYEITGKRTLKKFYENKKMKSEDLKSIFRQIHDIFLRVHEYLLEEKQLVLEGDFIYVDAKDRTITLMIYPDYDKDPQETLGYFAELLLDLVDYEDEKAVELVYFFYETTHDENFSWETVIENIEKDVTGFNNKIIEPSYRTDAENKLPGSNYQLRRSMESEYLSTNYNENNQQTGKENNVKNTNYNGENSRIKNEQKSELNSEIKYRKYEVLDKSIFMAYLIGIGGLVLLFAVSVFAGRLLFSFEAALVISGILAALIATGFLCWKNRVMWLMEEQEEETE